MNYKKSIIFDDKKNRRIRISNELFSQPTNNHFSDFNNPLTRADDPNLLSLIRKDFILPPSKLPYAIPRIGIMADGQFAIVDALYNKMVSKF